MREVHAHDTHAGVVQLSELGDRVGLGSDGADDRGLAILLGHRVDVEMAHVRQRRRLLLCLELASRGRDRTSSASRHCDRGGCSLLRGLERREREMQRAKEQRTTEDREGTREHRATRSVEH